MDKYLANTYATIVQRLDHALSLLEEYEVEKETTEKYRSDWEVLNDAFEEEFERLHTLLGDQIYPENAEKK